MSGETARSAACFPCPHLPWTCLGRPASGRARSSIRASIARRSRSCSTTPSPTEPEDLERTNGVVIVQHGAIVAERYAADAGPDQAFLSWSMAKSITNA